MGCHAAYMLEGATSPPMSVQVPGDSFHGAAEQILKQDTLFLLDSLWATRDIDCVGNLDKGMYA